MTDSPILPKAVAPPPKPTPVPTKVWTTEELQNEILRVPTLQESKNDETEHVVLYGAPGTAKTTQAGLLAEFYNILWFDGDKGLTALINNLPEELTKRIRVIRIPDSTMYPVMVGTMLKVITGRRVKLCFEHGLVDCPVCGGKPELNANIALNHLPKNWIVVMDSQTQFVASALALAGHKVFGIKQGEELDFFRRFEKEEGYAYWGGAKNVVETFGNYVKDLECWFVSIAHETQIDKAKTGEGGVGKEIVPVSGSDNSSRSYIKYYGTCVHCYKENNRIKFLSSVTGSNTVQAKSRTGIYLENKPTPALLHIFNPKEAEQLLKGSFTEWYLEEGWKDPKDRKRPAPKPKEILPL